MSAFVCPHCQALTNFTQVWSEQVLPPGSGFNTDRQKAIKTLRCNNEQCRMPLTAITLGPQVLRIWPERVGGKQFPDVPEQIAAAADEAYRCFSISALRGAVLLARSVIEATAKAKGITSGSLMKKIDDMHTEGLIREYVKDAAHEVRHLGNDMAHGDFVDPVEPEEAEMVLALMDEVLNEVFQSPARVAKARAARLAKQSAAATP